MCLRVAELQAAFNDPLLPIPPRKATGAAPPASVPATFDPTLEPQPKASTSHLKRSHKESGLARLSDEAPLIFVPVVHPTQDVSRPKKSLAAKGKERARQSPIYVDEDEDEQKEEAPRPKSKPAKATVKAAPKAKAAPAKKKAASKPAKKARAYSESDEDEDDDDGAEEKYSGLGEDEVVPVAKARGVRVTRKKAVVVVESESEEDDLGGYDDDEEEEEWRPEPVEVVAKKAGRRG